MVTECSPCCPVISDFIANYSPFLTTPTHCLCVEVSKEDSEDCRVDKALAT